MFLIDLFADPVYISVLLNTGIEPVISKEPDKPYQWYIPIGYIYVLIFWLECRFFQCRWYGIKLHLIVILRS